MSLNRIYSKLHFVFNRYLQSLSTKTKKLEEYVNGLDFKNIVPAEESVKEDAIHKAGIKSTS